VTIAKLRPIGERRLKGKELPVAAFKLVALG
jgi:hypothetical protein